MKVCVFYVRGDNDSIGIGYEFMADIDLDVCRGLLTHCGLVTPYGDRDLGQHWLG